MASEDALFKCLRERHFQISDEEEQATRRILTVRSDWRKGRLIARAGNAGPLLYFIVKGYATAWTGDPPARRVHLFFFENDFIAPSGLLSVHASCWNISLSEDSIFLSAECTDVRELMKKYAGLLHIALSLRDEYKTKLERLITGLQLPTVQEREAYLLDADDHRIARYVPRKDQASYIRANPTYFSTPPGKRLKRT